MNRVVLFSGGGTAPLPPPPTHEALCKIKVGFQGLTVHLSEYGSVPAFGPETSSLNDADLVSYCQQQKVFGSTHVEFDVSWQYVEPGYSFWCPGRDLSQNLGELHRRILLCIQQGMLIKLSCAGDGISVNDDPQPGQYNDPQGWTYGYQWACKNAPRIIDALEDLMPYIVIGPGYDGVFYGWGISGEVPDQQPARVANWARIVREHYAAAVIFLEYTPGDIPVGGGPGDYAPGGLMENYDVILAEFNADPQAPPGPGDVEEMVTGDQVWQPCARMTRQYVRPSNQPQGDDPNPPYYFAIDTPRGRRFFIKYEYFTYWWVRGWVTFAQVMAAQAYLMALDANNGVDTITC